MTKQELTEIFDKFAKASIRIDEDEYNLYGHSVLVTKIYNIWDVWVCNAKSFRSGSRDGVLGTKKLNIILATLPPEIKPNIVNGEAWFQTHDLEWLKGWLLENRISLGIAKRRPPAKHGFNKAA